MKSIRYFVNEPVAETDGVPTAPAALRHFAVLVKIPTVMRPAKYCCTGAKAPTLRQLKSWGMEFFQRRGDKVEVYEIPEGLYKNLDGFGWIRPF